MRCIINLTLILYFRYLEMTVENLLQLNKMAQGVINNIYPDSPAIIINEAVMYPVASAILENLIHEYLPPDFGLSHDKALTCVINIDGKVLRDAYKISLAQRGSENEEGAQVGRPQEFSTYVRLEDHFVNSLLYSTFNYLFKQMLHEMAPAGICSNEEKSHFTLTLSITAEGLSTALNSFISNNKAAIAVASESEYKTRVLAGVENTNAYTKSINDKLNEVAAIINDFRREVVAVLDTLSFGVNKILDIVIPEKVKKTRTSKKDNQK